MDICRVCLAPEGCRDIRELAADVQSGAKTYTEIMIYCLDIEIGENSTITMKLCLNCYNNVISFYKFKSMAARNDIYLKSVESSKQNIKVECTGDEEFEYKIQNIKDEPEIIVDDVLLNNDVYEYEEPVVQEKAAYVALPGKEETKLVICSAYLPDPPGQRLDPTHPITPLVEYCEDQKSELVLGCDSNAHHTSWGSTNTNSRVKKEKRKKEMCLECGKYFLYLKKHMLSHKLKPTNLTCQFCSMEFNNKVERLKHLKQAHSSAKRQCEVCNKFVTNLKVHHSVKHAPETLKFKCEQCDRGCPSKAALREHMYTHEKNPSFQCDYCQKFFRSKMMVFVHIRRVHLQEKSYQCNICVKTFFKKYHLDIHLKTHEKKRALTCPICSIEFSRLETLINHRIIHEESKLDHCPVCNTVKIEAGKQLCEGCEKKIPKNNKPKEQIIKCSECDKVFRNQSGYKKHFKTKHVMGKESCNVCGKDVTDLASHKKRIHEAQELPYACETCGKRHEKPSALAIHMLSHANVRQFACKVCKKQFATNDLVKLHVRRVHDKEKTHMCQYCSKTFFSKNHMERHLVQHTKELPFKCTDCDKKFATRYCMRQHYSVIHSTVSAYKCDICEKQFKRADYLRHHIRTHTQEKVYKCKYCDTSFIRSGHRRRHEVNLHEKHMLTTS